MARAVARSLRTLRNRFRFRRWITRLRFELWRHGARLEHYEGGPIRFDGPPAIKTYPGPGLGGGVFRLRLGAGVDLGRNLTLEIYADGDTELDIGDGGRLLNNVRILLRGGAVSIGSDSEVRDGAWLKSDGRLEMGSGVTIGPYSGIHCTERIVFADLVGLAERVSIADSDHSFDGTDAHYMDKGLSVSPVSLGRQTMVAFGAVVLRGAEIGPNSAVAANSVVRAGHYEAGSLIAGNPARTVMDLRARAVSSAHGKISA